MKAKSKRLAVCALACAMTAAAGAALPLGAHRADAAEVCSASAGEEGAINADPRALFAYLTFKLEGSDGEVRAIVKNAFTLFPGIVEVQIELYSSRTFPSSYEEMTRECRVYIGDLNQGNELTARAPTDGEQRYWMARVTSKIDSNGEQEKLLGPKLFDGNGTLIASWDE